MSALKLKNLSPEYGSSFHVSFKENLVFQIPEIKNCLRPEKLFFSRYRQFYHFYPSISIHISYHLFFLFVIKSVIIKKHFVWGIDGDWMVNIIPAGMPFYPTDHCGVLRINSDDILPKYLALALQHEGKLEKFSRSNRASLQRIKNLVLQIPDDTQKQKIVVDKVTAYETEILKIKKHIFKLNSELITEFKKMFGSPKPTKGMPGFVRLDTLCDNLVFCP